MSKTMKEDEVLAKKPMTVGELKKLLDPMLDTAIIGVVIGLKSNTTMSTMFLRSGFFHTTDSGTDMAILLPLTENNADETND